MKLYEVLQRFKSLTRATPLVSTDIVVVLLPPSSVMVRTYLRTHTAEDAGVVIVTKKDWKSLLGVTLRVGAGGTVIQDNTQI